MTDLLPEPVIPTLPTAAAVHLMGSAGDVIIPLLGADVFAPVIPLLMRFSPTNRTTNCASSYDGQRVFGRSGIPGNSDGRREIPSASTCAPRSGKIITALAKLRRAVGCHRRDVHRRVGSRAGARSCERRMPSCRFATVSVQVYRAARFSEEMNKNKNK